MTDTSWNDCGVDNLSQKKIEAQSELKSILQKPLKSELDVARGISIIEDLKIEIANLSTISKISVLDHPICLGITGAPGVGKSTFMNNLIATFDFGNHKVAILAIDPSSRATKGAVLGDRIRMSQSSNFENVYFRSIATRGAYGGLNDSIETILFFLSHCGFTLILIETVGVGQNEIEIADYADFVIHILDSNTGDEVQMEKAGVMEVGDIYFVNIRDGQVNHKFITNLESFISHSNNISKKKSTVIAGSAISGEALERISMKLKSLFSSVELEG